MTSTVVTGIGELVTNDPGLGSDGPLGVIRSAALVIEDGLVAWVGEAQHAPIADREHHLAGRCVVPGFVDSHSHLVFAGDRGAEFSARMAGARYDGGGIAQTIAATRAATDDELRLRIEARVAEMAAQGTTTVEIKSGYGGTAAEESRALRLAGEFTSETTFLGAHLLPDPEQADAFIAEITGPMLAASLPYSRWIDVFCEPSTRYAFDYDQAKHVLQAGAAAGLGLRVHGNQLAHGPGVRLAVELAAASVDHCTYLDGEDIDALASSATVATLLPGVEFSTRSPYPDARRLLDAGVQVALATDCNPGTCYSTSMPFMIALAVRELQMTPAEALWAATAGGAAALRRSDVGVLRPGARADVAVLDAPSYVHLAYRPGVPLARALRL
ncbi:imidazolonepropionase [Jatrophihabitans sp.]|uniref:imidazolonepropionase n=1 Tax=Jatrophihabitans sp. TaxID=1932789 RepID=UPI0030C6CF69|nr:hutI [Jatrophihabitans sp.]